MVEWHSLALCATRRSKTIFDGKKSQQVTVVTRYTHFVT